jgi:hypothetical protein
MGLFSKFKKKLTRGLRKVTPKEIAPILPFLAMAVPGMGGIMGSSMAKFLVPQLLTAAGSARTSGKINPLNQLLAAGSSLAGIDAANKAAAATASATPNIASVGSPGAFSSQLAAQQTAAQQIANPGLLDKTAAMFGKIPGVSKFAEGQKNLASLMPGGDPATFSMSMLAPISAGTTAAGIDQATLAQLEAEAEQARLAGDIQGYRDASAAVAAAIARFSDPLNQYGNNPFMANQGGRVGYADGDIVGDDILSQQLFEEMMGAGASDNVEGIPISLLESMAEEQASAKRKRDRELMSYFGMNQGGRIGMNMGGGLGSIPQTPTVPQGMQLDGRGGGFIPMGAQERKDDVPAMLAKNEFVMTADAVRAAGGGNIEKGAQKMYDVMNQLESQV